MSPRSGVVSSTRPTALPYTAMLLRCITRIPRFARVTAPINADVVAAIVSAPPATQSTTADTPSIALVTDVGLVASPMRISDPFSAGDGRRTPQIGVAQPVAARAATTSQPLTPRTRTVWFIGCSCSDGHHTRPLLRQCIRFADNQGYGNVNDSTARRSGPDEHLSDGRAPSRTLAAAPAPGAQRHGRPVRRDCRHAPEPLGPLSSCQLRGESRAHAPAHCAGRGGLPETRVCGCRLLPGHAARSVPVFLRS